MSAPSIARHVGRVGSRPGHRLFSGSKPVTTLSCMVPGSVAFEPQPYTPSYTSKKKGKVLKTNKRPRQAVEREH